MREFRFDAHWIHLGGHQLIWHCIAGEAPELIIIYDTAVKKSDAMELAQEKISIFFLQVPLIDASRLFIEGIAKRDCTSMRFEEIFSIKFPMWPWSVPWRRSRVV